MFYFQPKQLINYDEFAYYSPGMGGLSKEECQKVLELWDEKEKCKGLTGQPQNSLLTHIPNEKRQSNIQWIKYNSDTHWLFEKLAKIANDCNQARFNFQLFGFLEAMQLTEYNEGDHYDWHTDHGNGDFSTRKLSMVVQLTDPSEYEGGELQILNNKVTQNEQGTVTVFPSYNAHKVHPVKSGKRHSLVVWITGEPFR